MALIKINVGQTVASESAAKKPSYKIAKVGGVQTLVVNSAKKAELQAVLGLLKKAKTAAVAGMKYYTNAAKASAVAGKSPKGPNKLNAQRAAKEDKAKGKTLIKEAKTLIKEANSHAKKHGLGGLNLPLSATDIVLVDPGLTKAIKAVRSTKLTEFGVTGKRGAFKPKFVKEAAFDALGSKTTTKAAAKAPVKKMKGAITGAHTPAKAKALKEKRANDLGLTSKTKKKASTLDEALKGNPDKEVKKLGNVALDSFTTKRVPGTKVSIEAHDHAPASKEIANIVKSLIEKGGVTKGKFRVKGNSIEYKLGTASYRMSKNPKTGKWDSRANFGGNGGGSVPGYSLQSARKGLEASIKRLQKFDKVDRMAAQNSWMKGGK
ncbi:hypothetical protein pEaSNUABM30_00189 [Erwinia phage pEa_SNUABM_30]|uniref:Uncharacterized protein n=1 Tax=Erwinia phage pEa_SNUABM_30 TaxID=2869553 RepID=A0AAE8XM23_9CAUD|nr:hypothetical protein MPK69_gp189 [Erwinia phage pEa_SNUABM_30]UAW53307.1 hypothetical protein pEaSNUABM30_00189 [Erwinia phage pEa_SNUABM_30]